MINEITDSGAALLAEAIVKSAVRDYIETYKYNDPVYTQAKRERLERTFFFKPWFSTLTLDNIDPKATIRVLRERGEYAHWRYMQGCSHCSHRNCKHKINLENFTMDKDCEKEVKNGRFNKPGRSTKVL